MPSPKRRATERVQFSVSSARTVRIPVTDAPPLFPWPVAAIGGGLLAGLAGSLLLAGVVMVAWFSAIAIELPAVLAFAAQSWLLAHGGVLPIGGSQITLVPLGLTFLFGALCAAIGGFAYRQGRQARTGEPTRGQQTALVLGSIGQVAAGYLAYTVLVAWTLAGTAGILRPALGALAVSVVGAGIGALTASGQRLDAFGPSWVRRSIRGAAAGMLGLIIAGSVALGTAMLLGETRIAALEAGLKFDNGGLFVWSLVALAYLPNLLVWSLAWVLGGGFTVGTGSLVSLWTTQLGMLPAVPVFGALPPAGVASDWLLAWLVLGVSAGAVAGVVVASKGRTSVVGVLGSAVLAGLLAALGYLAWAAAGRGDLGILRLVDLGPRLTESAVIGAPLLVLSAAVGGLVAWFVRRRRSRA